MANNLPPLSANIKCAHCPEGAPSLVADELLNSQGALCYVHFATAVWAHILHTMFRYSSQRIISVSYAKLMS